MTRNCALALRHLRYRKKTRYLWVEAICIDQGNLQERAHQVQLMTAIYRRAARVLCWLGPRSQDSDLAMARIREISTHVAYDKQLNNIEAFNGGKEARLWLDFGGVAPLPENHVSALANLLRCLWFSRFWIWQEVHIGDAKSSLICGPYEITWHQFRTFVFACEDKFIRGRDRLAFISRLRATLSLCDRAAQKQLDQLKNMRWSDCQRPSDRLYTSQALATISPHTIPLKPDYTKSCQEVLLSGLQSTYSSAMT